MSSADAQIAYNQGSHLEPVEPQEGFAQQFDLSQPDQAKDMYQRLMHQHTKQQFDMASKSSRRSTRDSHDGTPSFSAESSRGSVSSTAS